MNWQADRVKQEAISDCGYRITWAKSKIGNFFNAYDPNGKHIEAGYDGGKVKEFCESHFALMQNKTNENKNATGNSTDV